MLIYEDDLVQLYHDKIENVIDQLPGIDLLLIDPPFGLDTKSLSSSKSKGKLARPKNYIQYEWMNKGLVDQELMNKLIKKSNHAIIWGGNYYRLEPSSCWFYWDKQMTCEYADGLLAWTNLPGVLKSIKWTWNGMIKEKPEQRFHPTQMPEAIINFSLDQFEAKLGRKPYLVLDCFAGSATTLACCKKRGIKVIGVEEIEEYCTKSVQRLSQGALSLF